MSGFLWDLNAQTIPFRIIYAYDQSRDSYFILGILERTFGYDKEHPRVRQIISDYDRLGSQPSLVTETLAVATSRVGRNVVFVDFEPAPQIRETDCVSIDDLVAQYDQSPVHNAYLERARQRIAADYYTDAGNPIARLRLQKGWPQSKLAEAIGSTQSHIARIESGKTGIMLSTIANIANALGTDPADLAAALVRQLK